jgi:hypothetical protein
VGQRLGPELIEKPGEFVEDGLPVWLAQGNHDDPMMIWMQMGDSVEKVPIGGEKNALVVLDHSENGFIIRSFVLRAT